MLISFALITYDLLRLLDLAVNEIENPKFASKVILVEAIVA